MKDFRIDTLSGDYLIYQPEVGQRYSTDDMLTAWMAIKTLEKDPPLRFLDLGSGLCSVPMILLWKFPELCGIGIELRENRRDLGLRSLEANGLKDRFELKAGDLRDLKLDEKFDLVTSTPPYYTEKEGPVSPHDDKSAARFELNGSIDDYFKTAHKHLSEKGTFITVYPYLYRDRVYDSAKKFKMSVNNRVDIIPKMGKPALISVYSIGYTCGEEGFSTLAVRAEKGNYTKEYNQARLECGFKFKVQ